MKEKEIYAAVLQQTGLPAQLKKMLEECEELMGEIEAGGTITPGAAEELADVLIVAGVINESFYAPAIAAAKRYKLRRMAAFLASGCKTWAQYKKRKYPGFSGKKEDMLLDVARMINDARDTEMKLKKKGKK